MPSHREDAFIKKEGDKQTEITVRAGDNVEIQPGEELVFPHSIPSGSVYFSISNNDLTIKTLNGDSYTVDDFFDVSSPFDSPNAFPKLTFEDPQLTITPLDFNAVREHIFGPLIFELQNLSIAGPDALNFTLSSNGVYQSFIRPLPTSDLLDLSAVGSFRPLLIAPKETQIPQNNQGNEQFLRDQVMASDDRFIVDDDSILISASILNNDSSLLGLPLRASILNGPTQGALTLQRDGRFVYIPNDDAAGTDQFDYLLRSTADNDSDIGRVTIVINSTNTPPVAADDSLLLDEDTASKFTVLDNDIDPDGDPITLIDFTQPNNGQVAELAPGVLSYTPDPNFFGNDTFTYTISDAPGDTDTATVFIEVDAINDSPEAMDDSVSLDEDAGLTFTVLDNDTDIDMDALTVSNFTPATNGTVTQNLDGTFTYEPELNFFGDDTFTYTISDSSGGIDTATVDITIAPINDAPVIVPGTPNQFFPLFGPIDLFPNDIQIMDVDDTMIEGVTVTISDIKNPLEETLSATGNGNISTSYDPMNGVLTLSGTDTLQNYETVLSTTIYNNSSESADRSGRSFVVAANDGEDVGVANIALLENGFTAVGEAGGFFAGTRLRTLASGDINGDGFDDSVIGAGYRGNFGAFYVLNGGPVNRTGNINLEIIESTPGEGFKVLGLEFDDELATASGVGDINGDGIDDINTGANEAMVGPGMPDSGRQYVLFGSPMPIAQVFSFANIVESGGGDATQGLTIDAIDNGSSLGFSASVADLNGDGLGDIIGGDPGLGFTGTGYSQIHVVFGQKVFPATDATIPVSELDGVKGFSILANNSFDFFGASPSGSGVVGDVNGDGVVDLLAGASRLNIGVDPTGGAFLIFGGQDFSNDIDVTTFASGNGNKGVFLPGFETYGNFGSATSTGSDINGDGFNELIISSSGSELGQAPNGGAVFVVYGRDSFSGQFEVTSLLPENSGDGTEGFVIRGLAANDFLGVGLATGGDFNGDGMDDFVITASNADPDGQVDAGEAYVIFGRDDGYGPEVRLDQLDSTQGLRLPGLMPGDRLSLADISGDLNGDGFDDLQLLSPAANPTGMGVTGQVQVIYGQDVSDVVTHQGTNGNDLLIGTADGDIIVGGQGNDELVSNGNRDVLIGGAGDDQLVINDDMFKRLDGGSGRDVVALDGANFHLDLTNIADNKIIDVEVFDITGTGDNTLSINIRDLLNSSESNNDIVVIGNMGDTLNADLSGFNFVNVGSMGGFTEYDNGKASLSFSDAVMDNIII